MTNYYAFIIGINQDWPEQRCTHGDIGLAKCLRDHCQLSPANLVEVYDQMATRSNVLDALDKLMDRRNKVCSNDDNDDVLLFYYGGHGKQHKFCTQRHGVDMNGNLTNEPWIKHSEIIDLLEQKFIGGTVISIIDTCHSGSFGHAVMQRYNASVGNKPLNVNYGCIMSVPPAEEAGLEWTMTECFIRVFKGEILCEYNAQHGKEKCYYLSTKKGKHPISKNPNEMGIATSSDYYHPTWAQVIEYLADEMARIKPDRQTTLFLGEKMTEFLQQPCKFGNNNGTTTTTTLSTASIPRDKTWMDPFRRTKFVVNDGVFVKCVAGESKDGDKCDDTCRIIGWYPGKILSIQNDTNTICIELYDIISATHWNVTVPLDISSPARILNARVFKLGYDPLPCVNVITNMANKLAYFDTLQRGIRVKVKWNKDGKYYKATTVCQNGILWKDVDNSDSSIDMIGPCVPVQWDEDKSVSFVSTSACLLIETDFESDSRSNRKQKISLSDKSNIDVTQTVSTPMDAMISSLSCQGKTLQDFAPDEEDIPSYWEAYDAEECSWEKVQLLNNLDISTLPLKVIAHHMCYSESGPFRVVYWESDLTLSVVPDSYLRQRFLYVDLLDDESCDTSTSSNSSSSSSDGGSSENEDNPTLMSDYADVRKYIGKFCNEPGHNGDMKSQPTVGLLLAGAFGFIIGVGSSRWLKR